MFDSPMSSSAYEVLRVAADVDDEGLRRAYRVRLRETHPDTGGDAALFVQVQRAWELVGTPEARSAYDRGQGAATTGDWGGAPTASTPSRPADTRPRARSHGQPGGWRRERYLDLIREWVGRGVDIADPYDPALVRSAPPEIRHILADALAEEETARLVSELGMGYTVWHDVFADRDGVDPEQKIDHLVLGPSGLYALLSEDFGGPVGVRRGEITGPNVIGAPVTELVSRARVIARSAGVRFSGAIVVLPDDDVFDAITELGKVRGTPVALVTRSALTTLLRRGITGAREVGGTELFDIRTRLQQRVRHV
ncbi:DnaJ domain-containing protein [Microbacterium sp. NPDC089180]|uniref:DnaJ domain-containing protein n=1 Tax=Microbacterium galbum TaxID=3075994 RepID=A0ABU3T746_9MICO|nr:DnaJ domain-containing protein [Microbacterium sp. KSW4-17]MDU0367154.1 DnaJ domain-containing protein [Microbacterium sp. KSW4-17]